ncbi:GTP 3',8-cyclase MoaA [Mechercharimyces sp. CAU 1602]|uniref:GTP 3',8-cyclase MoaA n=1 Tax=Mechercharimyces sp. CAU 1602 TaxID=2973933 RepID=UPI00216397D1|nr:GTP 3',8-cyclase MoaA [Mechercharimyces sp. CAU 1602]MCS1350094.1 GTP 3',8-cyclase MoaA [Mechercharimyces sp. CAU 1602]
MKDMFQRPLSDLRISVIDRCNFRCMYCMPEGSCLDFLPTDKLLSFDEFLRLVKLFVLLGVKKIRLTGGEPLLRTGLIPFIHQLREVEGIEDIALTTNGVLLSKYAEDLKEAGLMRVNVSLDTLSEEVFKKLNSKYFELSDVLKGIEAAAKVDLKIKVNMVVMKGVNDKEIVSMARYFKGTGHTVRFIEFMDVGNKNNWNLNKVVPKVDILRRIQEADMPFESVEDYSGDVAKRFRYVGSTEEFGIISSISDTFCGSCTRARISSDGKLYTCLFANNGLNLAPFIRGKASDEDILAKIQDIWNHRNDRYSEERALINSSEIQKIEMNYIGG